MSESSVQVLVVGAGPTGLTLAGELLRHRVQVRLIDKALEQPADHSRALAIQARTLELFDRMGVVDEVHRRGRVTNAVNVLAANGKRGRLTLRAFEQLVSPYPELLMLPQHETEDILATRLAQLGGRIERGVELTGVSASPEGVVATLTTPQRTESLRAEWVVGCDGAHSFVRRAAGIPFEGETYDDQCMVGDLVVRWELADNEVYICPSRSGIAVAFPIPGEHRFRVVLILPKAKEAPEGGTRGPLELPEFEAHLKALWQVPLTIERAASVVRYRLHHRVVPRMREGRLLIAGDAAHIHSPAGGQGMNTGIQDAYNLAWKLAAVVHRRAGGELIDSYGAERLPVARKLVSFTDRLFGAAAAHGPVTAALRAYAPRLVGVALALEPVQRKAVGFLSQLNIRYRHSPLSVELVRGKGAPPYRFEDGPRAGDRAPDALLRGPEGDTRLFDVLRGTVYGLLLFAGAQASPEAVAKLTAAAEALERAEPELLRARVIVEEGQAAGAVLVDDRRQAVARYAASAPCAVFIRPDGYIGFRAIGLGVAEVEAEVRRRLSSGMASGVSVSADGASAA